LKSKRIILWTIVGLILANSIFLASAINIIVQSYSFSSGRFAFQYDDTKVVVDRVGNFIYDSEGKLEKLTIYVKNKDSANPYSGYIEGTVGAQSFKIDVSVSGGETKGYNIDLSPHLTLGGPLVVNVNVIIGGTATADLIAQKGAAIADASIDGTLGTEWNDARSYTSIPITPSGTASIRVKNDGTNLYMAIQLTADSNNPWVALQMGATGCMDTGSDGVLLGHDSYSANGYVDIEYDGTGPVLNDATQNGRGAITVGTGNLVTVEIKKPLNSGDAAGADVAWTVGNTYGLVIAWDTNGGGSSGGTANHRSTSPIARTIQIGA
jgi:hypothetical protein